VAWLSVISCSSKIQNGLPFCCQLTQVVLEKGPLNGCSSSSSNNSVFFLKVGKAMSSNESAAYKIMRSLDVDYVLVIFGGVIGYSGDDINKFLWMVRIAEGEHPKDIRVCSVCW